mmetsp:Transcript_31534/g.86864  ORF Transcript_31534/g.86864 Transcript_31534/m.86864 type:complete len:289 (+) Transcript_31534:135-1001(+)
MAAAIAEAAAVPEGAWTCKGCGNVNFAHRNVCNTRKCAMPRAMSDFDVAVATPESSGEGKPAAQNPSGQEGSWTCKGCGNVNFAHRSICNTRKCAMPRALGDAVLSGHPEGSWVCPGCQNVNFKHRTVCNTRTCGAPKPGFGGMAPMKGAWGMAAPAFPGQWGKGCMGYGPAPQMFAADWGKGAMGFGKAPGVGKAAISAAPYSKGGGGGDDATGAPASWTCKGCNNLNYGQRDVCNTRKCALPRHRGHVALIGHPEGSWYCAGCGNVNYQNRTQCNTRKCGLPCPGL